MDKIIITLKLYSGIHSEINLSDYCQETGIVFHVKPGVRLRKILKRAGITKPGNYIYFSEGERVSIWSKIKRSGEISCLKQSGGG
jgi:DMSO/TMAO reductase YedYZ molybdopterin-dependent catalytic subunit